jgi:hypothetical protein
VVILESTLPTANDLKKGGKRVRQIRERSRTLAPEHAPIAAFQVDRFPGSRIHAVLAVFQPCLSRFKTWGDLRSAPIGKWYDVQLFEGDSLVGFSVREEGCVFRTESASAPRFRDCYGDMQPLSPEWMQFLESR